LTVFANVAQKFQWPAKRTPYAKADCCHLNRDTKRLKRKIFLHLRMYIAMYIVMYIAMFLPLFLTVMEEQGFLTI